MTPIIPAAIFPPELLIAAQNINIVFFDVDGVMTDGSVYFSRDGETLKCFNTLDGYGIKMLRKTGITPVVISGRDSMPLRNRISALGIDHAYFGVDSKHPVAEKILTELKRNWSQAGAMGDDWPDLAVMRRSTFACAPANAHVEVRSIAKYVTRARGGNGAAREFCDLLVTANGNYASLLQENL